MDNEPISGSHFSSFLHILPLKLYNGWISMKSMKTQIILQLILVDLLFFQIFNFIGSSVITLSLSEIPIWTHQRQLGLTSLLLSAPQLPHTHGVYNGLGTIHLYYSHCTRYFSVYMFICILDFVKIPGEEDGWIWCGMLRDHTHIQGPPQGWTLAPPQGPQPEHKNWCCDILIGAVSSSCSSRGAGGGASSTMFTKGEVCGGISVSVDISFPEILS